MATLLILLSMGLYSIAARALAVVASLWTASLQLWSASSLAYRAAGDGLAIDLANIVTLAVGGLAAADLIWHDALRRGLILPRFPLRWRHQVCVGVYAVLAGAFGIRAFIATGDPRSAVQVGVYYVLVAGCIAILAAAMAAEHRHEGDA